MRHYISRSSDYSLHLLVKITTRSPFTIRNKLIVQVFQATEVPRLNSKTSSFVTPYLAGVTNVRRHERCQLVSNNLVIVNQIIWAIAVQTPCIK
jgi:hypothetical protein